MIQRREFLVGLFLTPAIVHSENLMKIWVPKKEIITIHEYDWTPAGVTLLKANFARHCPNVELKIIYH